ACDAKGIVAAQIAAAERLRAEGVDGIGLLFVVDEETGSVGARAANAHPLAGEWRWLRAGEPPANRLAAGPRGTPSPPCCPAGAPAAGARDGPRVRDLRRPLYHRHPAPHGLGYPLAARAGLDPGRAQRTRADLRGRARRGRRRLCPSGARARGAEGRGVKIALFGHGTMGRVLEESARAAGEEIGVVFTSANVGDAPRLLPS